MLYDLTFAIFTRCGRDGEGHQSNSKFFLKRAGGTAQRDARWLWLYQFQIVNDHH